VTVTVSFYGSQCRLAADSQITICTCLETLPKVLNMATTPSGGTGTTASPATTAGAAGLSSAAQAPPENASSASAARQTPGHSSYAPPASVPNPSFRESLCFFLPLSAANPIPHRCASGLDNPTKRLEWRREPFSPQSVPYGVSHPTKSAKSLAVCPPKASIPLGRGSRIGVIMPLDAYHGRHTMSPPRMAHPAKLVRLPSQQSFLFPPLSSIFSPQRRK
jgi:hypothetical protein